jgi:N-acyl-D-amino-acid deacylase
VLKLVEEGKLDLDTKVFELLKIAPARRSGAKLDARLTTITVRQLLQHTGGWDRNKSFDPMFRPGSIAKAVGSAPPADAEAVIRYMLGQPLDFDPGARHAYSNFGYCVLGRVIELVTSQTYEGFVREQILGACGIRHMQIGASLDSRQAPGEVRYYMQDGAETGSIFPAVTGKVPWPYGGFHLEAMDAHGGWIAPAVDLARFAVALDDPNTGLC